MTLLLSTIALLLSTIALATALFVARRRTRDSIDAAEHGPDLEAMDAWALKRFVQLQKRRKKS